MQGTCLPTVSFKQSLAVFPQDHWVTSVSLLLSVASLLRIVSNSGQSDSELLEQYSLALKQRC